jgi:hypothetical protein
MKRTRFALFLLTAASLETALAQPALELYRRVVPLETTTGVISLRERLGVQIEVPEECEDGALECTALHRYGRVYGIGFEVETRRKQGDDLFVEREPRGTAYLALAAERDDEDSYDERLRSVLAGLSAASFDEPYAGLRADRSPFGRTVAERSVTPSWSCFEEAAAGSVTRYSRDLTVSEDGTESVTGTHSSTHGRSDLAGPICRELNETTAGAFPDEIRTISTPRALIEEVLSVDVSDLLLKEAYPDQLVPLPDGSELTRRKVPGVSRSQGISRRDDEVRSRLAVNEVETEAFIFPAELPEAAVRENAWHSRWRFETIARRIGPLPESRTVESWSMTVSLLPTRPPRDLDNGNEEPYENEPNAAFDVHMHEDALFTSIGKALDLRAELSASALADTIVKHVSGLDAPGWILVICPPDGTATWGLPPTRGRATVNNGKAFCRAVGSYFP